MHAPKRTLTPQTSQPRRPSPSLITEMPSASSLPPITITTSVPSISTASFSGRDSTARRASLWASILTIPPERRIPPSTLLVHPTRHGGANCLSPATTFPTLSWALWAHSNPLQRVLLPPYRRTSKTRSTPWRSSKPCTAQASVPASPFLLENDRWSASAGSPNIFMNENHQGITSLRGGVQRFPDG